MGTHSSDILRGVLIYLIHNILCLLMKLRVSLLVLFLASIQSSSGLKCYYCNSLAEWQGQYVPCEENSPGIIIDSNDGDMDGEPIEMPFCFIEDVVIFQMQGMDRKFASVTPTCVTMILKLPG